MMNLSASSQDYLETILDLSYQNEEIRSVDIAEKMNVSRASVNKAIGILKTMGYITQERYACIMLTQSGRQAAINIRDRHNTLKYFFSEVLGIDEDIAEEDACRMEHAISKETFEAFKKYIQKETP
ncbi:MAG: metal-dependent transcriptional regulator [Eubacteriales bacterium]|jgi:DtxR family Mn-dependent transcriptional regulator